MSEPSASGHGTAESFPAYGLLAEFQTPNALVKAARAARGEGYRKLDAYTPFPIEELTDALDLHHNRLPLLVLLGGLAGGSFGYLLQYFITVIYYPINVGGRPLHSWPEYFVITFECTILFAGLTTVLGLLGLCGLPMPYHPVFNAPNFRNGASTDKFFLCLEATDPKFDTTETRSFLEKQAPLSVVEVEY